METWKPIPGIDGFEASSEGRIRKFKYVILKPLKGTRARDYPRVTLIRESPRRERRSCVHVFVAEAFLGERPPGYEVNHKDGNKQNCRPDNLEYVTRSQNQRHKFDVLGVKINQGSAHGMSRLTETEVQSIKLRRSEGRTLSSIATEFRVSVGTVSMICNGKTWRHLLQPPVVKPA